jgi:sn-glycerol 3-phosphate transport system ATP-binding protein
MNVISAEALARAAPALAGGAPADRPIGELAVGVRPEAVRIGEAGVPATIVAAEYLGADSLLEARVGGEPFVIRSAGRVLAKPGETVHLAWDAGLAHWFDKTTGRQVGRPAADG